MTPLWMLVAAALSPAAPDDGELETLRAEVATLRASLAQLASPPPAPVRWVQREGEDRMERQG